MNYPIKRQFPVRPRPNVGEDFKGYVLRIAFRNGYDNINIIHRIVDIPMKKACFDLESVLCHRLIGALAKLLRLQAKTLHAHFSLPVDHSYDAKRAVKDCTTQHLKLCLDCIKTEGFIHKSWLEAHHTHCSIHQKPLIDKCPNCGARLPWKPEIFEQCPMCEFKWQNYSVIPTNKPTYFAMLEKLSDACKTEYLCALYQALVYVIRPLDAMHITYQKFPNCESSIHQHFEQAYQLLTDKQYASDLEAKRYDYFSTNSTLCQFSNTQLLKISKLDNLTHAAHLPWQSTSIQPALSEEKSAVKAYRNQSIIDDDCYHYQVNFHALADILHIDPTTLTKLVKSAVIPEISGSVNAQFFLFDLRKINNFIQKLREKSCMLSNTPTISFSDAEALFKLSNMDSIQLIVAILNGELAYQLEELEGAPFFQGCRVDKIALLQLIEKCFPDSFSSILTKNKIQQYCSIGEKQFQYFKSLFSTELVIPHNGMSYIQPEALSKFFKTTLFLNRWCKLNELNVENTLASLSNEGIKPIFYSDKDLKIYFYKKTEVLEKFLWSLIK